MRRPTATPRARRYLRLAVLALILRAFFGPWAILMVPGLPRWNFFDDLGEAISHLSEPWGVETPWVLVWIAAALLPFACLAAAVWPASRRVVSVYRALAVPLAALGGIVLVQAGLPAFLDDSYWGMSLFIGGTFVAVGFEYVPASPPAATDPRIARVFG